MDFRRSIALFALVAIMLPLTAMAAPIANDDTRTVPQGVQITIDVLNNDFDDEGFSLSIVEEQLTQPANGTVVLNSDGGITYTPDAGYIGQDQFQYTVTNDAPEPPTATANVFINVVPLDYPEQLLTSNETSVALSLTQICGDLEGRDPAELPPGQDQLAERCLAYTSLESDAQKAAVVQQVTPEETLTLTRVGSNASEVQGQIVSNRMMQLGTGLSTINQGGLTWSSGHDGGAAGDSLIAKLGFFASLQLEDADKDRTQAEAGFDYTSNGLALGADYAISNNWFAGGAFGYTINDLEYRNDDGKVESDIYTFIAYSTYNYKNFSFDVQVGGGNSNIDISRYMAYDIPLDNSFSTRTKGETSGSQWFVSLQTQYAWSNNALTLYPLAKINYTGSRVKGYADNDAQGWEVVLGDQKIERFMLEAALQATYAFNMSWGVIIPNADLTLLSNINTSQDKVTGYFAYAPKDSLSFDLNAEEPDSFYYQLGLGSSFLFPGGNTGFIGLRQTLGYDDYSSLQLQAGMRMEF